MNRIEFTLNNQPIETKPVEFEKIQVSVDWTGSRQTQVEIDTLTFRNAVAEQIIAMRSDSLGSFNGRPFGISVGGYDLPEMMLNLRKNFKIIGDTEVQVAVEMVHEKDWITEIAAPLQFRRLEEEGAFAESDYYQVPYNINYIPDGMQVLMLSISIYNITKASIELVKETAEAVAELVAGLTPNVGVGVSIPLGQILLAIAKIAIRIAYFIALALAIKNLVQALFEQLYSQTRYHTSIKIKSLFVVACEELGLEFESDLLDGEYESNLVLMPSKTERGKKNINLKNFGTPARNDDGLYFFGEFISSMMEDFNADYRIVDGVMRFERWDWWQNNSTETLDSNWTNQSRRLNESGDNADDFKGGYFLSAQMDQTDRNTLDEFGGTAYDVITNNVVINEKKYDLSGGSVAIEFPFAFGVRKDELSFFERTLKALATLVDGVTSVFGNGTNFAGDIEARKGNLQLSDHFTEKPKLLLMDSTGRLAPNQRENLSAKSFWTRYHFINSFYPIDGIHNQWETYSMIMKINKDFFVNLLNNNFVKDSEGNDVEIEKLTWNIEEDAAEIQYRVNNQYNFNLRQSYVESSNTDLADNYDV